MRVVLRGIHKVRRKLSDGTVRIYYYHRATGRRIEGVPGSPEFLKAYNAAQSIGADRLEGTVAGLIRRFRQSPEWAGYRESTRTIMNFNLDACEREFGAVPLDLTTDPEFRVDVIEWRDGMAEATPRAADAKVSALSTVFSWGRDRGAVPGNPLSDIKRVYRADRSDLIWLPEHIAAFNDSAPAELRNAMMVALHTGQRQGDILAMVWSNFDGASITIRQSKGRKGRLGPRVYIPCTAALLEALEAFPRPRGVTTVLTDANGRPWTPERFKGAWRRACGKIDALAGLHFHDLRGTAVTMLSEAGCTPQEIASITGHSLAGVERILDVYLSRTRALADSAIRKLEEHQRNRSVKRSEKRPVEK